MTLRSNPLVKMVRRHVDAHRVPRSIRDLIREIRSRNLTTLSEQKLTKLARLALDTEARAVPGIVIEAGREPGGSASLLAASKSPERRLRVFDVAGMIPPTGLEQGVNFTDMDKENRKKHRRRYFGYEIKINNDHSYEQVKKCMSSFGYSPDDSRIDLISGALHETLTVVEPVALAHLAVDWYEAVKVGLERIVPHLSNGGAIVLDDYFDWPGCRQAADDYFVGMPPVFRFDDSAGSLVISRR